MRRALLLAAAAMLACAQPRVKRTAPLPDIAPAGDDDEARNGRLIAELREDILLSYERDEPPETETGMLDPKIGAARIGAGPGDFLIAGELERAPSRWPLFVDRARLGVNVVSKRLEIHVAQDQTAAWVFDELSWRVSLPCGRGSDAAADRIAVIPLRVTALYAHDGDRWVPVFEHLSFAHAPAPTSDGQLYGKTVAPAVVSRDLADELSRIFSPLLGRAPNRPAIPVAPDAVLLGPDVATEWHGADAAKAQLAAGPLAAEDRRVGYVGRSLGKASVAYWVGNVVADLPARPGVPAGKARMRATFVFERRKPDGAGRATACSDDSTDCRWVLAQGHVSESVPDEQLAIAVFGTALEGLNPLAVTCADGTPLDLPPKPAPKAPPKRPPLPTPAPSPDRAKKDSVPLRSP